MKCWLEDLLEVDTIKGCGKHQLYKINDAFENKNDGSVSIDEAIEKLKNYDPKASWEGWEDHAPRWKSEAKLAAKWLTNYRDKHFK